MGHARNSAVIRTSRGASALFALAVWLSAASAAAQTPQDWQPPPPMPDAFDWIQLTSGEWLKGELIALYDGSLEFDSDELDNLTLDWGTSAR